MESYSTISDPIQTDRSLQAEQELIGDILIDARCIADIGEVTAEDFDHKPLRDLFAAAKELYDGGAAMTGQIDPVMILQKMNELGTQYEGARDLILQLMEITPTAANAAIHASAVLEASGRRMLQSLGMSGLSGDELLTAVDNARHKIESSKTMQRDQLPMLNGMDVEETEIEFLFEPYLRAGAINLLSADPGTGKTSLVCYLTAMLTTGKDLDGSITGDPANVLIMSVEDELGSLKAKIRESGGDVSRVQFFDTQAFYKGSKSGKAITFTDPRIETAIKTKHIRLVVFDPLQNFLGANVDMNQSNKTRPILSQLDAMAKANNCAVLILTHQSKGLQRSALMRSLGSVDFAGIARSVLTVGDNPDKQDEKICVHTKANGTRKGSAFAYQITGEHGHVIWKGYTDHVEADLDRVAERKSTGVAYEAEPTVAVIRKYLSENISGGFLSWGQYNVIYDTLFGGEIEATVIRSQVKKLSKEIARRDHVSVDLIKQKRPQPFILNGERHTSDTKFPRPGMEIRPLGSRPEDQLSVPLDDPEMAD